MDASGEGPPATSAGGRERVALTAILITAVGLRLWGLARFAFEQDELYTLRDAADLGATAGVGPGILGRPLYYLLQHGLLTVLPPTPVALRAPALVFGVLGIVATWWAARRLIGPTGALVAALLVAVSPWHLYHSQFARYWTLVYLLAMVVVAFLPAALEGRRRAAAAVAIGGLAGALSHPTFLFALVGVAAGATAVKAGGRLGLPLPTRNALVRVWLPLLAPLFAWYGLVRFLDDGRGLRNPGGAPTDAGLRAVLGMVQWLGPTVVAASLIGIAVLWSRREDRRLAAMCAGGILSMLGLMLLAGTRTTVYADYGTAALPLVFLAGGAAAEALSRRLSRLAGWGFAALVVAGVLPQTVSHAADGTRFDFRPAHAAIRAADAAATVVGWPIIVHRHYAPDLRWVEADADTATYARLASEEGGFWAISAHRRRGVVPGGRRIEAWIGRNCEPVDRWETPRLDYRRYAVELAWCKPRS